MIRRFPVLLAAAALLAGLLAGCGDDDTDVAGTTPTTPTTEAEPAGDSGEGAPERIVSLSATATETLFAIGAGDDVVAVDDRSTHPPEAPVTDLSGFQPNIEAITSYDPDLVVISFDPGDLRSSLESLGVEVLEQQAAETLDDAYAQITELGEVTGHDDDAAALVEDMQAEIDQLVASAPDGVEGLAYYHELDENLFTVTSDTFLGSVYGLFGLRSIADAAADQAGGYPQLSAEFVVEADPDVIFLADTKCCGQTAETVAARPGWSSISAVENGAVIELDDDIASRWGPRIVDLVRTVSERLSELEPALEPAGTG